MRTGGLLQTFRTGRFQRRLFHARTGERIFRTEIFHLPTVAPCARGGATANRAQADALEIECLAKIRLADEYDAAQKRGEIATVGQPKSIVPNENNTSTAADLGITSKEVHEARQIRRAARWSQMAVI